MDAEKSLDRADQPRLNHVYWALFKTWLMMVDDYGGLS
jgi:hypothetical protein